MITQQPTLRTSPDYDEHVEVLRRRFEEARKAGLSMREASLFAESNQDIGVLRKLVEAHCDPALIGRIVT